MSNNKKKLGAVKSFVDRHCGFSESEQKEILKTLGFTSLEEFGKKVIPSSIYSDKPLDLGKFFTEKEILDHLREFGKKNTIMNSMIGTGYYGTETPAVIVRNLLENPSWYTAYTPYQAEISQGRLEMLLNFQTMISDLTGLPLANASLLDAATAAAETMSIFYRMSAEKKTFMVDSTLFPQVIAILKSRAALLGINLVLLEPEGFLKEEDAFGCLFPYPGGNRELKNYEKLIGEIKKKNIHCACITDPLALVLLKPPGEVGFEIAIGSTQRFGVPMGFGGPHAGFMAFEEKFKRQVPGRIVGVSKDSKGRVGYRLALQTREQHIRREKATSNICTAQALPAMIATAYAIYHGPENLIKIANKVHQFAAILSNKIKSLGYEVVTKNFFDTIRIKVNNSNVIVDLAEKENINIALLNKHTVSVSCDELTNIDTIRKLVNVFATCKGVSAPKISEDEYGISKAFPGFVRQTKLLNYKVFNSYHTEHELLRYLKKLADKDIALNRSMIPLGSCTMKLNGTTEMIPITWPEFANIHPFAPKNQVEGYLEVLEDLSELLEKISGFDFVSLQPNAGSQGELAGLVAIKNYLQNKGQHKRNICMMPKSAHGTNPASAVLAGFQVVLIEIDKEGQVLLEDLKLKVETHKEHIAALMMTYPSTCGVFGEGMHQICEIIHQAGGQVYMDGANLNALVGVAYPGKIGPDVMHINLHKTFCIPHGGGGPGMGPIGVKEHLAPFLPDHPFSYQTELLGSNRTISAAPFGSGLILLISWIYIRLMGGDGLRKATLNAILAANYIVKRLEQDYPVVYKGKSGFVAHECILDIKSYKETARITVEDVAKRLMDYGYHAPTISWPVAGAMMIEPTESESKVELDKFCDALLCIRQEIRDIEQGKYPKDNNMLVNAPHTAEELLEQEWKHSYSRKQVAYPLDWVKENKYWPPVSRIDAAWGDRNLSCSCLPIEDYET